MSDHFVDGQKLIFDVFKHIMTLASATVVALAAELIKPRSGGEGQLSLIALVALGLSIVGAAGVMMLVAIAVQRGGRASLDHSGCGSWMMIISVACYVIGYACIASLAVHCA